MPYCVDDSYPMILVRETAAGQIRWACSNLAPTRIWIVPPLRLRRTAGSSRSRNQPAGTVQEVSPRGYRPQGELTYSRSKREIRVTRRSMVA